MFHIGPSRSKAVGVDKLPDPPLLNSFDRLVKSQDRAIMIASGRDERFDQLALTIALPVSRLSLRLRLRS
jgi:hypothetical protein